MSERPAPVGDEAALGFVAALRGAGVAVPVGSSLLYVRALAELEPGPSSLYWAGRATLVHGPEEVSAYDRAFQAYWLGRADPVREPAPLEEVTLAFDDPDAEPPEGADGEEVDGDVLTVRFSAQEVLREKDFARLDADELDEVRRLMADLRLVGARRRSRRSTPTRRRRGRPDLGATVRAALRTGGEPVRPRYRRRGERPRRLVLLVDISGSMEPYSRALLRFVHATVAAGTRVEAFTLGTRLTRLTRELATRDPDTALANAAAAVADWSGGTRLGESLRRFNDTWGVRGMARGAVVVILSDGWDRGEPEVLAEQMERLHRVAFRVVWVNPLKATPGYEPLARGMAAALPFVDEFVEGHSLASLEELARTVADAQAPSPPRRRTKEHR